MEIKHSNSNFYYLVVSDNFKIGFTGFETYSELPNSVSLTLDGRISGVVSGDDAPILISKLKEVMPESM